MENLENISTEELEKELQKRKALEERPKVKEDIDLEGLITMTETLINNIVRGDYREDDEHYVWEKTMETIYGDNFFDWFNEHAD